MTELRLANRATDQHWLPTVDPIYKAYHEDLRSILVDDICAVNTSEPDRFDAQRKVDQPAEDNYTRTLALQNLETALENLNTALKRFVADLDAWQETGPDTQWTRARLEEVAHEIDQISQERTALSFRNLHNAKPRGSGWVGAWSLGSGAFGSAGLFVRLDDEERIAEVSHSVRNATIQCPRVTI